MYLGQPDTWVGWGEEEKGLARSREEEDILLFIPDLLLELGE